MEDALETAAEFTKVGCVDEAAVADEAGAAVLEDEARVAVVAAAT